MFVVSPYPGKRSGAIVVGGAVLVAALGGSACTFQPDYSGTSYLCGADQSCPSGFVCVAGECAASAPGAPDGPIGMPATGTWTSDTSGDFTAAGYNAIGTTIVARGAIEPAAYYTGGLLVHASASSLTDSSATWDQVTALAPS